MDSNNLSSVQETLDYFIETKDVPHLLFYGPSHTDKEKIVFDFLDKVYGHDSQYKKKYTMYVNCAFGTGIKFFRDDLKFFAKTNLFAQGDFSFKTIILSNAEYLTPDAQSALRRCIELFSKHTRFIFIVNNKHKILNPILSRFCEIFVHTEEPSMKFYPQRSVSQEKLLKKILSKIDSPKSSLYDLTSLVYEQGISGLELCDYLEQNIEDRKTRLLFRGHIEHTKQHIHYEPFFIRTILQYYNNRNRLNLENK